ncbi:MAG: hypothetical protein AAGC68_11590, partial [Verrucomicrobiota bacterium]
TGFASFGSIKSQTVSREGRAGRPLRFVAGISNFSLTPGTVILLASKSTRGARATYLFGGVNVTGAVRGAGSASANISTTNGTQFYSITIRTKKNSRSRRPSVTRLTAAATGASDRAALEAGIKQRRN